MNKGLNNFIEGIMLKYAYLSRPVIFAISVYLLLPLFFYFVNYLYFPKFAFNYFSFSSYSFVLFTVIVFLRKEVFMKKHISDSLIKKIIFGFLTYMSFLLYFTFKYRMPFTDLNYAFNITASFFTYILGVIFLAFLIFGSSFLTKNFKELFSILSLLSLYYVLTNLLWDKWQFFSSIIGKSVFWVLSFLITDLNLYLETDGPLIQAKNFLVSIGAPCSGIDSISLFLGIFLILILYEHQNLNRWKVAVVFSVGIILISILNIIRVASIILLGIIAPNFALGIFHSQIGALLFILFILFFLEGLYWWMEHGGEED